MRKIISFLLTLYITIAAVPIQYCAADYSNGYVYMDNRTQDRESPKSLAAAIYSRINTEGNSILETGKTAYNNGKYEEALNLYRNYFVEKMRKSNCSYYPNYTPESLRLMLLADVVCGKKTLDNYYAKYPNETWVDDCLGAFGSPYIDREINWLGGIGKEKGTGYWGEGQEATLSWIGMMGAAYYNSNGDRIYLDKFFEVLSDFSINHYNVIKDYEIKTQSIPIRERDGRTWQWQAFHMNNERFAFIVSSLIQFCKLLPAAGETDFPVFTKWDDIVRPFGAANPIFYDLIDPIKLARFVVCSVEEIAETFSRCYNADITSNQRNSGARHCIKLLAMFSEFTHLENISKSCSEYLTSPRFFYKDGTFLEQSFNYNDDEARCNNEVISFYRSIVENEQPWLKNILEYNDKYYKFREAFLSNALLYPKIGNGGDDLNIKEIWKNNESLSSYIKSKNYTFNINPPGYSSAYFPWGGYAALRSGWNIKEDMTLQLYNSETAGGGHTSLIRNGIWLAAYGRPLIVSGEGALYGEKYLPANQRAEYNKWVEYFGETATRKGSTVMVNDDSQARASLSGEPIRTTTEGAPIVNARYHDSDHFNYVEGKYKNGYIDETTGVQYESVTHTRQCFFIKEAKMWIINDIMKNADVLKTNEYSQIWRLPTYSNQLFHNGFTNEEVVVDENTYSIKTQDKGTVNLFMNQFSNQNLHYKKYYGSKGEEDGDGIYRGWTANGIQGLRVPVTDVYVRWNDSAEDKVTSVMTAAIPSKSDSEPYRSVATLNMPEKDITGFKLVTKDNVIVTSLHGENGSLLETGGIKAKASNIITVQENDLIRGIVFGCKELYYNGLAKPVAIGDFEFIIEDGGFVILSKVTNPSDFEWAESSGKEFIIYSQNDKSVLNNVNKAEKEELKEWILNNQSDFNLYRERSIMFDSQIDFITDYILSNRPFTKVSSLNEAVYLADKAWLNTVAPAYIKNIEKNTDSSFKITFDLYKPWELSNSKIYIAGYGYDKNFLGFISQGLMENIADDTVLMNNTISVDNAKKLMLSEIDLIKTFIWSADNKLIPLSNAVSRNSDELR